ncbi:MAG: adenylate/guanylate cyclase domain-containing protein [Gemmataceae bacterium]|nr:adenylate/guanylate cyclase domain-containing protein [Gemmataceae bacterium]
MSWRKSPPLSHAPLLLLSIHYLRFRFCLFAGIVIGLERGFLFCWAWHTPGSGLSGQPLDYLWQIGNINVTAVVAGGIATLTRNMMEAAIRFSDERNLAKDTFGQFVSKDVAEKILRNRFSFSGDTIQAGVLFLDIRNFIAYSSRISPEETVAFLNQVFGFSVEEIEREGGVVNKFLGDGFLAIFGAPLPHAEPVAASLRASQKIFLALEEFNRKKSGSPIALGIGIHYGPMVAGVIGTKERREYTVIGDTVNIASRIEEMNKVFGSRLLISSQAVETLRPGEKALLSPLPPTHIKGRSDSLIVYREAQVPSA